LIAHLNASSDGYYQLPIAFQIERFSRAKTAQRGVGYQLVIIQ
jgi:hypothetical protein